jgi:hypothetical protein
MFGDPASTSGVTYHMAIRQAVRDLGTATPHVQVLKLLSWMYGPPVGHVIKDCNEEWHKMRRNERNQIK